jgi:hypothetical protein
MTSNARLPISETFNIHKGTYLLMRQRTPEPRIG